MTDPSGDFIGNLADTPSFPANGRHTLAIIGTVDPTLLDLVGLVLTDQNTVVIRAGLHFGADDDETSSSAADDDLVRLISHNSTEGFDDEPVRLDALMPSTYPIYSLREVLAAVAQDRTAQDPGDTTVILLPAAIELVHLLLDLAEEFIGTDVRLARTTHVLDAATALGELPGYRRLSAFLDDTRCMDAVHLTNLEYADLVLALRRDEDPAGVDLIEYLHPRDTLLLPDLGTSLLETFTTLTHDVVASLSHIHPATTSTWGGPDEHDVWALDLSASLPLHPECLRSPVAELAGQGLCTRGCFWLPNHPGRVCTWETAGGAMSVDDAGTWAEVPVVPPDTDNNVTGEPHSHLVVTGVGNKEMREQVRRAFSRVLLRSEEVAQALTWIGAGDGLGNWFGQEG